MEYESIVKEREGLAVLPHDFNDSTAKFSTSCHGYRCLGIISSLSRSCLNFNVAFPEESEDGHIEAEDRSTSDITPCFWLTSWFYDIAKHPVSPFEQDGRRKLYDRLWANGSVLAILQIVSICHARGCRVTRTEEDENAAIRVQHRIYYFKDKFKILFNGLQIAVI